MPAEAVEEMLKGFVFLGHPNAFDEHHVHIMQHGDYMMDKYWEFVASENPALQMLGQAMMIHIEEHKGIISQGMMQQAQMETEANAYEKGNTIPQLIIKKTKPAESKAPTKTKG
jgi:hypothetical protein